MGGKYRIIAGFSASELLAEASVTNRQVHVSRVSNVPKNIKSALLK